MRNTIPTPTEVDLHLSNFFTANKTKEVYVGNLVNDVIDFFGISEEDAFLKSEKAHGRTSKDSTDYTGTYVEALVSWSCNRLLDQNTIKRTKPNTFQHIHGPSSSYHGGLRVSSGLISEAMVSVKILRDLKWEPERIICELHQWSQSIVEAAIKRVYHQT
jgi:hypothetical protein